MYRNLPGYSSTTHIGDISAHTRRGWQHHHRWESVEEPRITDGESVQTVRCAWCGKSRIERTTADPEPAWHPVSAP